MESKSIFSQEKNQGFERTYQNLALLSMVSVFLYTALRAHLLSMSHDESLSYLFFVRFTKSFWDVATYKIATTNNHLLNSLLMRVTTHWFGENELAIRMPNLFGHLLFLTGIYQTLRLFLKGPYLFIGTLLIIFQPFPLDYFTCARGYGLGLGFMSIGLYFYFKTLAIENFPKKALWLFLSFFMFAFSGFSNLAFLNVLLALILSLIIAEFLFMENFFKKMKEIISLLTITVIPNFILLATVYAKPIQKLKEAKEFYHGGTGGFWKDTVGSLITSWVYGKDYPSTINLAVSTLIVIVLIMAVLYIFQIVKGKNEIKYSDRLLISVFLILFFSSASIWTQHVVLGTVFPYDRAAIYFIPIFLLLLLLIWNKTLEFKNKLISTLIANVTALLIIHSLLCLNLTHFFANKPDAHTKQAVETMAKLTENKNIPDGSLRIGVQWWFEPAVNFYLIKNNLKRFLFVDRKGFDEPFDFYYVREEDKWVIDKLNLKVLKHYDVYPAYLAVPQNSPFTAES